MTSPATSVQESSPGSREPGKSLAPADNSPLNTNDGKISVNESVVSKIAGMACREVSGVANMGTGGSRTFGAIRQRIPGSSGPNVAQGVGVEVGETQAAVDLDIVVEYGVSIADIGRSIQRNVKQSVERMTGLEVVEVNVNVDDVHLPDASADDDNSRVA
jgi:uncharacterized alkaline shock family protein YloU